MEKLELKNVTSDAVKSQLVAEICSISSRATACTHMRSTATPFIDWYRLLGVDENAVLDTIRRRYRKLALQLHPDKNHHPKAEFAFKLVYEAYACLSDESRRKAFNLEKWRNFCLECHGTPYTAKPGPHHNLASPTRAEGAKPKTSLRGFKDIRERFKEEARVIESCLRANRRGMRQEVPHCISSNTWRTGGENHLGTQKESPIFDPAHYTFDGYPHLRNRVGKVSEDFWSFKRDENGGGYESKQGRAEFGTPIFMSSRSEKRMSRSRSVRLCSLPI